MDRGKIRIRGIDTAVSLHQQGKLDEAEAIYRQILRSEPTNPNALHLLGVIAYQRKRFDEALDLIGRAIAVNKHAAEFQNNLGNVYLAQGRLEEAASCYRKALRLNPKYPEAHNNLGNVLKDQGKLEEAIASYRRALRLDPASADVHNNLGLALTVAIRFEEAVSAYREAIRLRADFFEAYNNLGNALKGQGKRHEAMDCYKKALAIHPGYAEAYYHLGNSLVELGWPEEGAACYREALRHKPGYLEARINLGHALSEQGKREDAVAHYKEAILSKPDSISARWGCCIAQIPLLYDDAEDIPVARERYRCELEVLREEIRLDSPQDIKAAAEAVGSCQPFYLAYQGQNDRELQSRYGDLVVRIQSARYPQWSRLPPMPSHKPAEPLRIGIVSGFFFLHSNWKIPIKGWVENLNKERFQLHAYYTGHRKDAETDIARRSFVRFTENAGSLDRWCEIISKDRLHVLVFPEIGMDPTTLQLASLRLAPVQCTSWGHPDTSGLPTIDYYVSSDLMEPPDADLHYREHLVRLPNLSIHYTPLEIQPPPVDRAYFGLRKDAVVYLCAQSLYKYLPQYDEVFPRIARNVGDCQFAFLSVFKSPHPGQRFLQRLEAAFARHGLRLSDYVAMIPHLQPEYYQALNCVSDVFLDSIGWSGCNSTFEAISHNLPVASFPGKMMRGRHSYAILRMMEIDDTVARDIDEYVRLASQLAIDIGWREEISTLVAASKHKTYRDTACITGLEEFLTRVVSQHA